MDIDAALQALNLFSSAGVAAAQIGGSVAALTGAIGVAALSIKDLIPLALCGQLSSTSVRTGGAITQKPSTGEIQIRADPWWSEKHLDPRFNYDFTKLKDTETYYRGGEKYKRPCGWQRFAIKVLDEYEDNTWLGNNRRSTESVPGEWPVSYHGTRQEYVKPIIAENFKAGPRKLYGRGIYSTPDIDEAEKNYAIEFTTKRTRKTFKAVLQNRINPEKRKICEDRPDYWLVEVPAGTTAEKERDIVEEAIRPYGLLVKEVR